MRCPASRSPRPGVVTTTASGRLQVWDPATGRSLAGPVDTGDTSAVVATSPTEPIIATGGSGSVVQLWNEALDAVAVPLSGHKQWVAALAFDRSGRTVVSAGLDGQLWSWSSPAVGHWNALSARPQEPSCHAVLRLLDLGMLEVLGDAGRCFVDEAHLVDRPAAPGFVFVCPNGAEVGVTVDRA